MPDDTIVFDAATAAALKLIIQESIREMLPEIQVALKGLTLKGTTLNLNEGKGKVKANVKGTSTSFLTEETKELLRQGNVNPDLIRFYDAWNGYAKALNNPRSGNPADAVRIAESMATKEGFDARFQTWLKKHPLPDERESEPSPSSAVPLSEYLNPESATDDPDEEINLPPGSFELVE
jgi:hypothetical protein